MLEDLERVLHGEPILARRIRLPYTVALVVVGLVLALFPSFLEFHVFEPHEYLMRSALVRLRSRTAQRGFV
mgnify:CR=1 FL=1